VSNNNIPSLNIVYSRIKLTIGWDLEGVDSK